MPIDLKIPSLGDSVSEAVLTKWLKNDGEYVKDSEPVAELETDKANVDLPASAAGVFKKSVAAGTTVKIGQVVGSIDDKAAAPAAGSAAPVAAAAAPATVAKAGSSLNDLSPAPRRIASEAGLDPAAIPGTGPGGRVTKEDAQSAANAASAAAAAGAKTTPVRTPPPSPAPSVPAQAGTPAKVEKPIAPAVPSGGLSLGAKTGDDVPFGADGTKRVPMTKIRKAIATRLVAAQHTAAILTTFNEVDLTEVMALRAKHKDAFEKQNGVGLGFMSFFVKAVCQGLKAFPRVNAQIDGDDVVFFDHVHMAIAVSTERGLVVPVIRNAHALSFAQIESEIKRLALAARDGKLGMNELSGGTFSVTNGGVFGSLLSTPILNPPQSAILGMHTIQKRPVVISTPKGDEIQVRNMMYLALSYDHRLVDGKESVSFLVKVKQLLEDPSRLLLDV